MTCCQHSAYSYALLSGIRYARCQRCGHEFMVILGGPDRRGYCEADAIQNDVPGVEARQ